MNEQQNNGNIILYQTEDGELQADKVVAFFATTTQHGAIKGKNQTHQVAYQTRSTTSSRKELFTTFHL